MIRELRDRWADVLSWLRVSYYRAMGTTIGERCYISSNAHIDVRRGRIVIGNKVSIAGGTYILGHTGHQTLKEGQVTRLHDNVRVFVNAVVLPGVTVGENSVVGAGAVVGRDVPPNVLVIGNPARVVQHLEKRCKRTAGTPDGPTVAVSSEGSDGGDAIVADGRIECPSCGNGEHGGPHHAGERKAQA